MKHSPTVNGIAIKKWHGQHFLRDQSVINHMINHVTLNNSSSVFEIGCGDGFLTRSILNTDMARLWIFEIDSDWVEYVKKEYPDPRVTFFVKNFLDIDFSLFTKFEPWTLLANLPYNVSFPIIYKLVNNREFLKEGVIMVQEEVAQKIVSQGGRTLGYHSLYLQHFFEWKLLVKIKPGAFFPPPQVDSRLLYFKPKQHPEEIPYEDEFWKFITFCFKQPRRTLKNNLAQTHYDLSLLSESVLQLRAQQMQKDDFLTIWRVLKSV